MPSDVRWGLLAADLVFVVAVHVAVGFSAPRWPDRWLQRDVGPLRLTSFDRVERYRRWRIPVLLRWLPEAGDAMGGRSKSTLPGTDPQSLRGYLVEVRRAQWVHLLSMLSWPPLLLFNPPAYATLWFLAIVGGNLTFVLVLRYNQVRLTAILVRSTREAER